MKSKDGFIQAYNAQAAVDATAQVIVAHGLDHECRADQRSAWRRSSTPSKPMPGKTPTQLSGGCRLSAPKPTLRRSRNARSHAYIATGPGQARGRGRSNVAGHSSPPCAENSRSPGTRSPYRLSKQIARAGLRTDQAGARLPSVSLARRREGRQRVGPRLPRPQYLEARPGADPVPCRTRNRLSFATSETVQRTMAAKLPPLHQTGCANLLHPALRLACSGSNPISPGLSRQAPRGPKGREAPRRCER